MLKYEKLSIAGPIPKSVVYVPFAGILSNPKPSRGVAWSIIALELVKPHIGRDTRNLANEPTPRLLKTIKQNWRRRKKFPMTKFHSPRFDPENMRFKVGDWVECRISDTLFVRGCVLRVLPMGDHGKIVAYRVAIDDPDDAKHGV